MADGSAAVEINNPPRTEIQQPKTAPPPVDTSKDRATNAKIVKNLDLDTQDPHQALEDVANANEGNTAQDEQGENKNSGQHTESKDGGEVKENAESNEKVRQVVTAIKEIITETKGDIREVMVGNKIRKKIGEKLVGIFNNRQVLFFNRESPQDLKAIKQAHALLTFYASAEGRNSQSTGNGDHNPDPIHPLNYFEGVLEKNYDTGIEADEDPRNWERIHRGTINSILARETNHMIDELRQQLKNPDEGVDYSVLRKQANKTLYPKFQRWTEAARQNPAAFYAAMEQEDRSPGSFKKWAEEATRVN